MEVIGQLAGGVPLGRGRSGRNEDAGGCPAGGGQGQWRFVGGSDDRRGEQTSEGAEPERMHGRIMPWGGALSERKKRPQTALRASDVGNRGAGQRSSQAPQQVNRWVKAGGAGISWDGFVSGAEQLGAGGRGVCGVFEVRIAGRASKNRDWADGLLEGGGGAVALAGGSNTGEVIKDQRVLGPEAAELLVDVAVGDRPADVISPRMRSASRYCGSLRINPSRKAISMSRSRCSRRLKRPDLASSLGISTPCDSSLQTPATSQARGAVSTATGTLGLAVVWGERGWRRWWRKSR